MSNKGVNLVVKTDDEIYFSFLHLISIARRAGRSSLLC